jgi:hypothetical protein
MVNTRLMLLAALLVHFATSADAGTIFTVDGNMSRDGAKISGTLDIDTIDGSLDAVDLMVAPVTYGFFPGNALHVVLSDRVVFEQHSDAARMAFKVSTWWAYGAVWLTLPGQLVDYAGGPIRPTTSVLNFQSGVTLTSPYDAYETRYFPMVSGGTVTPMTVPEPSTLVLAFIALVGLVIARRKRRSR